MLTREQTKKVLIKALNKQQSDNKFSPRKQIRMSDRDVEMMVAIAQAESKLDPRAANPDSSARGLWQIMASVWLKDADVRKYAKSEADLLDAEKNALAAIIVWKKQGFQAWETYLNGDYEKFYKKGASTTITDAADIVTGKESPAPNSITGAVNAVTTTLMNVGLNAIGMAAAIAMFVVGILLLTRQDIKKVVSVVPKVGG